MSDYVKEVVLPSKGVFYKDHPELAGAIKLRMLTGDDEKLVFGSSTQKLTKTILERAIVEPKFDTDILLPADRQFLFMQLRIFTYGDDYHLKVKCPNCPGYQEVKINLTDDLVVHELPEDFDTKLEIELPVCKKKLVCKYLTVEDVERIATRAKNFAKKSNAQAGEFEFIFRKAWRIVSIDGKEEDFAAREKFVRGLVGHDSAYLDFKFDELKLGYDYEVTVKCPTCGEDIETVFEMNSEFFRPRFD